MIRSLPNTKMMETSARLHAPDGAALNGWQTAGRPAELYAIVKGREAGTGDKKPRVTEDDILFKSRCAGDGLCCSRLQRDRQTQRHSHPHGHSHTHEHGRTPGHSQSAGESIDCQLASTGSACTPARQSTNGRSSARLVW